MHGNAYMGNVIHSARTVGGGAGLTVIRRAAAVAPGPAAYRRAGPTLPLSRVAAGRDAAPVASLTARNVARYTGA